MSISPVFAAVNPIWFGIIFSIAGALLIEELRTEYKHYQEIAIPIIMSAGIGISVIFISLASGFNQDLFGYLFGSISAVNLSDLFTILAITIIVLIFVMLLYKSLFVLSFDEEYSRVIGMPKWIQLLFIVIVALVISASMRVVGILLVSSLMTLPVATSMRLAKGFKQLIGLSILFGELSVILGLILSFYLNISPGGIIVGLLIIELLGSITYSKVLIKKGGYHLESRRGHSNLEE